MKVKTMKCHPQIINRIKRSEGQIRGVIKMIEEGRTCEDLTTQLKAIESSIRQAINLLTIENLKEKIKKDHDVDFEKYLQEIDLILKR